MRRRTLIAAPLALSFAQAQTQTSFPSGSRIGHVMAYDPQRRALLLFGGLTPPDPSGSEPLWIHSEGAWRQAQATGPLNRSLPGAAFDTKRGRLVVYGGIGGDNRFGDLWEWEGSAWNRIAIDGPGPRDHHAMAYDSARERVVLHGGSVVIGVRTSAGEYGGGTELWYEETWEYDGTAWKALPSPGPGTRAHHCMAYDPIRKVTLLVGGMAKDRHYVAETWGWDGSTWKKLAEGGLPPRARSRMAFHEPSGEMVLYGGDVPHEGPGFEVVSDTWVWNGKEWKERKPKDTPGPRFMQAMAYHAEMKRVVLYAGKRNTRGRDDAWTWDGENWALMA